MTWLQWHIAKWFGLLKIMRDQRKKIENLGNQIENLKIQLQYERIKNNDN